MNEKQDEAIKSLNNTLVIAGAGSGKTYTIINKVNYLIQNKIYGKDEILLISFTNESVNDIKNKLRYEIDVKTFHKLAIDLINNNNYHICPESYLNFIINEYLIKNNKYIKRLLLEIDQNNLKSLIFTFINLYKSNYEDINYLYKLYNKSLFINKDYFKVLLDIYLLYESELKSSGQLDFNDLITMTAKLINENKIKTKFKLVIIDEFQDTSLVRFKLIKAIVDQNKGKIFAVGDDYQSIYRFSGCDLYLFINLYAYIDNLNIIKLDYNYRNNQTLINIANNFIIKNKKQIRKNTLCLKDQNKPIKIIYYVNKSNVINNVLKLINTTYLIIGRYNKDKDDFNIIDNFMTIHKSKGLEAENIILIMENIPSSVNNHKIINKIVKNDYYPFEEERRIFYVALTRSKNNVYILCEKGKRNIFINELIKDNKKNIEFINMCQN